MSKLEVEIGASINDFKKSMAKVLKEFDQVKQAQVLLNKEFKSGKISADSYYNSIAGLQAQKVKLSSNSTKLKNSLLGAQQAVSGVGKATSANAVPALNEFSRVIQDAPYGIQGVANNITQLTTQFGYLTKKTGSAKGALKAMLGSLTGPAGILLAISAVTSLLVSFGGKLFSSSKKADKLKKSTKGLNKELQSQSAILKKLIPDYLTYASIKEKTIFNTTKEKEEVKALFAVLRDESKTVDQRARAYKALEKSYTKYLKGVKPKDAKKLANAEKQILQQLEIREKKAQTLIKLEETTRSLQLLNLKITKQKAAADLKGINISDAKKRKLELEKQELIDLQNELRKTLKQYTALDTSIAELKDTKPIVVPITTGQPAGLTRVDTGDVGDQLVGLNLAEIIKPIDDAKIQMQMALLEFNEAASQIINNNIANTFAGIGQAIGDAMSGAGNLGKNLTKVLLGSMGNLLQQLGKLAIKTGVTLKAVKSALEDLNPKVAIAAGIAAVAVGKAFSSSAARLGGSMGTGSVAGAGSSSGFSSGTTFGGARPFSGNLTFTIRGTDLVAVLNSANSQNAIIGGNVSVG